MLIFFMKGDDFTSVLNQLFLTKGFPKNIRSDNGSEFIVKIVKKWLATLNISLLYIEPGSP